LEVLMSKFCFLLIAVFSLLSARGECLSTDRTDRMYVQPTDIALKDREIWIRLENRWVQVNHLSTDATGVYLAKDDLPLGFWVCKNGHTNYPWTFVCFCGATE
jgi:hypothetical protein